MFRWKPVHSYIFIECTNLTPTQRKFYNINSMKELFGKIDSNNLSNFLKGIGLKSRM